MSASRLPTARLTSGRAGSGSATSNGAQLVLSRYRLQRRLGAGGFGTVWMARDERLERDVAVKILPRERIVGGRFEREARAAARLSHPGIVTLYEAAVDDEGAYLVSELVCGATLRELLEQGRLSDRDILELSIAICDALGHAHAHGVVHRDVKPSNVLIADRPSSPVHPAKLTDFGVARVAGGDSLTRTGDVVGTAAYMAPEQAEGREAGPSADLYALALVTYEALTGINPVRTGTAAGRARRLGAHLPPVRRQRRDLPRELGAAIDLALRPKPRERGTIEELRAALAYTLPAVTDTPGIVTGSWPSTRGEHRSGPAEEQGWRDARPQPKGPPPRELPDEADAHVLSIPWPRRAIGATAAAAAAGWLGAHLLTQLPLAPLGIAAVAWLITLLLPRIGWIALTLGIGATAAAQHRPGGALVFLLAALAPVVLMPRSGTSWPLPAAAPALGLIGLAGTWPALAAKAGSTAWRRAALGLLGYVWLTLASPLAAADLYVKRPPPTPAPHTWTTSPGTTVHDVIAPIFSSGVLAAAPIWALSALLLPYLLRNRSLALDVVLVTVWAAVTVSATQTAIAVAHGKGEVLTAPTAVQGALAGALVALLPAFRRAWRKSRDSGSPQAELA